MRTIFVSAPYTHPDPVANTRAAILFGAHLRDTYNVRVFVPHLSHYEELIAPKSYDRWLEICLDWLPICDVLFRMPGESRGADAEVAAASLAGIPVVFTESELTEWLEGAGQ